jgi:transposase
MVIPLSMRKWITIKPAIWITFIPAKMHKNQPAITGIFIIPKKNSKIQGPKGWKDFMRRFMNDPITYPGMYFKRNNHEAGFSAGKRSTGHMIFQKRKDRIETLGFCKGLLHNLMLVNR